MRTPHIFTLLRTHKAVSHKVLVGMSVCCKNTIPIKIYVTTAVQKVLKLTVFLSNIEVPVLFHLCHTLSETVYHMQPTKYAATPYSLI
jgi:hypothetical protein